MDKFKSCAEWPEEVRTGDIGNITTDQHESREAARAVCRALERDGFGGDGQHYPLRTWVEGPDDPMETWLVRGDHPIGKRPDKRFTGVMEAARSAATLYTRKLREAGYENVTLQCLDEDDTNPVFAIPQQPQRQDALDDQLRDLIRAGNRLGLYDAVDCVQRLLSKGQR